MLSLSDDEDDDTTEDYTTLLSARQLEKLANVGFCKLVFDETENPHLMDLINGYIRSIYRSQGIIKEIVNAIAYYHGIKFDEDTYIQLISGGENPVSYLVPRINVELSKFITAAAEMGSIVPCKEVPPETLDHVLTYLGHHRGREPDPLPCPVRSIHMAQIVSDKWDARWMDAFDKKTIFEITVAANYLDIKCLCMLFINLIFTLFVTQ